jgi:2-keto-4-pentenoate hydratase
MELWFTAALLLLAGQDAPAASALPSAARCTALFAITLEQLKQKSGDPAMTAGFVEDTAALRAIVIAEQRAAPDPQAAADAEIAAERRAVREAPEDFDLKPCYRVKALGPLRG